MDDAVADVPPCSARRYRTRDMVEDGDIGGGSDRTVVSHPDIGLDTASRVGGTAADLILELGDDKLGRRSRLKNEGEARAVVRLVRFGYRSLVVGTEVRRAGTGNVRESDRPDVFLERGCTSGKRARHGSVIGQIDETGTGALDAVAAADIRWRTDIALVGYPSAEPSLIPCIVRSLPELEAACHEIDEARILVLDRIGRHLEDRFGTAVVAFVFFLMVTSVVVIVPGMIDAVDDVVDARFRDPLTDDRVFGLGMGVTRLQVIALRRRTVDPLPCSVSAVNILLVPLGEVEVAGDGTDLAADTLAVADILGLGFGIEGLVQAELVYLIAPRSDEPSLPDDEVGKIRIRSVGRFGKITGAGTMHRERRVASHYRSRIDIDGIDRTERLYFSGTRYLSEEIDDRTPPFPPPMILGDSFLGIGSARDVGQVGLQLTTYTCTFYLGIRWVDDTIPRRRRLAGSCLRLPADVALTHSLRFS